MTKSQSPAKKIRSLKRLLTFRLKCRVQHLNTKLTKSSLSICTQTAISIEPNHAQLEPMKRSKPFTLNDFVSLSEASRKEENHQREKEREKEREEREKEREKDLMSFRHILGLPPL